MTQQSDLTHPGIRVDIRPMQLADVDQVLEVDRISFPVPWPRKAYLYELTENKNSMLWVAEANQPSRQRLIVGMIVIWVIVDEAHIATLAVQPEFRGHGIAKRLLTTGLEKSVQKGAIEATLEVREANKAAQALYSTFQFEVVGQRARYYRDNQEDAIIMTLKNLPKLDFEGAANLHDATARADQPLGFRSGTQPNIK